MDHTQRTRSHSTPTLTRTRRTHTHTHAHTHARCLIVREDQWVANTEELAGPPTSHGNSNGIQGPGAETSGGDGVRDSHHVGVGGGGVFRIALAEPLNNAEEAGAKLPSVGRNTGDELGETG